MPEDFRTRLKDFSGRMVERSSNCKNEEGTIISLVLPFLEFLRWDIHNSSEVCPQHGDGEKGKYKTKVDFAIIIDSQSVISIECKMVGNTLVDERGQLKAYFNEQPSTVMGILTDGLVYDFYACTKDPHCMDKEAFLSFDMKEFEEGKLGPSADDIDFIKELQKGNFDPDNIEKLAKPKHMHKKFIEQIRKLSNEPSDEFVRELCKNVGETHLGEKSLEKYKIIAKQAFQDCLKLIVIDGLNPPPTQPVKSNSEDFLYGYVKQRLAFLVDKEGLFEQIEKIHQKKLKGKSAVYFDKPHSRLFYYYTNKAGNYCFDFGDDRGVISTNKLAEIDNTLLSSFKSLVEDNIKLDEQSN
jgi:hypothetical protein